MELFVVKHSLDGLRLALSLEPPSQVLLVGQSLAGAALLSQQGVVRNSGPASARWGETLVSVLEPLQGPYADLLDELRQRPGPIRVVLLYQRLREDLPPLDKGDRVRCFWEIRDDPENLALDWLGRQVESANCTLDELCLYSRRPLEAPLWEQQRTSLLHALGQPSLSEPLELPALEVSP